MKTCCHCGKKDNSQSMVLNKCQHCNKYVCTDCEKYIYSYNMKHEQNVCPNCFDFHKKELHDFYVDGQHRDRVSGYYG